MTHRLPPDIDRMLWEVAESQDQNAFDDFEHRFPHLVGELGKRIQLVRELRDARGNGTGRPVPRFDRRAPTQIGLPPRAIAAVCILGAACLGLGAYAVTSRFVRRDVTMQPVPHVNLAPVPLPDVVPTPSPKAPDGTQPKPKEDPIPPTPPYLVPVKAVNFPRIKLQLALQTIARNGGLEVEFAPNMPNPDIRMEYHGMDTMDMIRDLGPRFRFTAFRQGPRQILIIPAVDRNAAQLPPVIGSGDAVSLEANPVSTDPDPHRPKTAKSDGSMGPS